MHLMSCSIRRATGMSTFIPRLISPASRPVTEYACITTQRWLLPTRGSSAERFKRLIRFMKSSYRLYKDRKKTCCKPQHHAFCHELLATALQQTIIWRVRDVEHHEQANDQRDDRFHRLLINGYRLPTGTQASPLSWRSLSSSGIEMNPLPRLP